MTLVVTDEPPDRPARASETLRLVGEATGTWRGVAVITVRLAKGEPAGRTGQPHPAAAAVARDGIRSLARKAAEAMALNTFGWLLTLPDHYMGPLDALDRGTASAL